MDRLEKIREIINDILIKNSNIDERYSGFVHLYGVSSFSGMLALKRGLNSELCAVAGMLHDIASYKTGNSFEHAKLGSIEARKILSEAKSFSEDEINIICTAIYNHSDKDKIDGIYDEVLKDADVLQHYLYNTNLKIFEKDKNRLNILLKEIGIEQ